MTLYSLAEKQALAQLAWEAHMAYRGPWFRLLSPLFKRHFLVGFLMGMNTAKIENM